MFQDAFVKLGRDECETVLGEINPALKGGGFKSDSVTVLGQEISFYQGYRFLDIADHSQSPPHRRFVIHKPGEVVVLDGTNEPIYKLNERAPIVLIDENIVDYAKFFFTHVRGRHGRFLIVESVDDVSWREEPPPGARKAMGKIVSPVALLGKDERGAFLLSACMIFKDSLFRTRIHVQPGNGIVSLSDEEIAIEDMPVTDDTLGQ